MKGLEGEQHDHVTPLHVLDAGPGRDHSVPLEPLKWAVFLEDGVQVPDEQHPRAGSPVELREQVARSIHLRRHVDPTDVEAESGELFLERAPHLPHAGGVHRPAVDVDDALEERDRFLGMLVDVTGDRLFRRGQALRGRGPGRDDGRGRDSESESEEDGQGGASWTW